MRSVAHKSLLAAAAAGLLLAAASCAKLDDVSRKRAVDDAAAQLHRNLKASKFAEIYDEASYVLRAKVKKDEFVEKLRGVRARLGDILMTDELHNPEREYDAEHDFVTTNFDVDGSAEDCSELMFWDVSGSEAKLLRYGIILGDGKEFVDLTP